MHEINFTDDQKKAVAIFDLFLADEDQAMILTGGAGTGKSTLMTYLLETMAERGNICGLLGKNPITNYSLTATTNKAAEVLQNITGQETKTIHSLLGLQVYNDFSTGETKITLKRNAEIIYDRLIFVDECSMIDRELLVYMKDRTRNCKFVFIGDHCQLAPVSELISQVFTSGYETARLNEIVRSKGAPPITELCLQLRETVETGVFSPLDPVPGYIEYLDPQQMQDKLQEYFIYPNAPTARILAFRNDQVKNYNIYLRQQRGLPELFTEGEEIVSNSASYFYDFNGNKMQTVSRIEQEIKIHKVEEPYADSYISKEVGGDVMVYRVWVSPNAFLLQPVDMTIITKIMAHARKNKNWDLNFYCKQELADLRSKDACTVYKSQGSTYHTTFIDLADIGRCNVPAQVARMLYVACSRSTNKIYFYGQLPPKYSGG